MSYSGMNVGTKTDTVYFSSKGQVIIPRRLRQEFEIEAGTRAYVQSTAQGILLQPLTARHIRSLRGSLTGSKAMDVFTCEGKKERKLRIGHGATGDLRGAPALSTRTENPRRFSNGSTLASISSTGYRIVARP